MCTKLQFMAGRWNLRTSPTLTATLAGLKLDSVPAPKSTWMIVGAVEDKKCCLDELSAVDDNVVFHPCERLSQVILSEKGNETAVCVGYIAGNVSLLAEDLVNICSCVVKGPTLTVLAR